MIAAIDEFGTTTLFLRTNCGLILATGTVSGSATATASSSSTSLTLFSSEEEEDESMMTALLVAASNSLQKNDRKTAPKNKMTKL